MSHVVHVTFRVVFANLQFFSCPFIGDMEKTGKEKHEKFS